MRWQALCVSQTWHMPGLLCVLVGLRAKVELRRAVNWLPHGYMLPIALVSLCCQRDMQQCDGQMTHGAQEIAGSFGLALALAHIAHFVLLVTGRGVYT